MGNIRKAIASLSLVAILSTLVVSTTAFAASDVQGGDWFAETHASFVADGVIDDSANFYPNRNINRAEVTKVLALAASLELQDGASCGDRFPDCPADAWFAPYFVTMNMMDIVRGNANGEAMPGNDVNRADLLVMLHRLQSGSSMYMGSDYFSDVPAGSYYDQASGWGYCYGVVSGYGDGTYRPGNPASRAEAIVMIERGLNADTLIAACDDEVVQPPVVQDGDLTVRVSSSTPDGDTIPSKATAVEMVAWDFTAGDDDAVIQSLTVHKTGVSGLPSGHQVYLYMGDERLTSGKSINSTTREASFNNVNVKVDDGETVTLSLRMDVGTVVNTGEVAFELENSSAVVTGGSVSGSFPLEGEMFDLSDTAAGTITLEKNGTVPNPKVGEDDVTIAKFKMTTATEAANLEQLSLYVTGNVNSDEVENLRLYVGGEDDPIADVASVNGQDLAVFSGIDFTIDKGDTKTFEVKADLNTGRAADEIKVYVDESSDVRAIGDIYNFGMQVDLDNASGYDGTACTSAGSYADCTRTTVEGGDITISSSGPAATDVAIAGDDVVLLNFSITAVANTVFKNFPISLTASEGAADTTEGLLNSTNANFTDIRVVNRDTGETVLGPIDADVLTTALGGSTAITEAAGDNAIAYYLFTDEFEMEAGDELNLALTTDIENTSTLDGMTILGKLELGSTYPEMRDVNNKTVTNSSTLVPASTITGKTMTVSSPALTANLAAVPVSDTFVKGSENVKFLGVSLKCGSASDCEIDDVTLTGSIDDDNDGTYGQGQNDTATDASAHDGYLNEFVGSVWLEDSEGNVVADAESVLSTGAVNFTSIDWNLDGGETEVMYVVGNISSDAYKNSDAERISFSIESAGDITYTDDDGNSRNASGTVNTAESTYMTTSDGGSLTITVDPASRNEDILVSGSADQAVSKFKFTTTDEAFVVTKLGVNARQGSDAVTLAALGNQDNNITNVRVTYTNSDGVEEVKVGQLSDGTVELEGMDFFVPKDDDATLSVAVDVNDIETGATAGEYIDLNISFANFEAVASDSGETYKGNKIDASVSAGSDLDFGAITWTDGDGVFDLDGAQDVTLTLGGTLTLTIDDGAGDNTNKLPVGTLLCVDDDDSGACTTEDIYVVTAWDGTSSGTEDTVTVRALDDAGDDNYADNDPLLYALPGAGYLTGSDRQYVYKTLPTLALAASSPSGSRTVSTTDEIFKVTITPDANDDIVIRQGLEINDDSDPLETTMDDAEAVISTTSGEYVDGTGGLVYTAATLADNDCFLFDEAVTAGTGTGALGSFNYMSFYIKTSETDVTWDAFEVIGDDNNACAGGGDDQVSASTSTLWVDGTATAGTAAIGNDWALATVDISGLDTTNNTYVGFTIDTAGGTTDVADTDVIYIDGVVLHNELLTVDLAGNAVFDTTPTDGVIDCTLKDGTSTVASGAAMVSTTSQARLIMVPQDHDSGTDYSDIEITKGSGKTLTLVCDTQNLISQTGNDDLLTPSIDYGSSTDGTVTRGDFWWSADEATKTIVYWLGDIGTKLSGSTLKY